MRRPNRLVLIGVLVLQFAVRPATSRAIVFGGNDVLSTPTNGQFFVISPGGLAYVQIASINDTWVFLADATPFATYTVNWQMAVGESTTQQVLDSDTAFFYPATTDVHGFWHHLGHNTGPLSGYNDFPEGDYIAYVHVGGSFGGTQLNLNDFHDFTVGPP